MSYTNHLAARVSAAFAAVAVTLTLVVSSFADPNATTVAGLLA